MEEDLHQETKLMASSRRVFYIKLNIQKAQCSSDKDDSSGYEEEEEDAEYPPAAATESTSKVCMFCRKGFSSGKALGGHMRIHVQSTKQPLRKKIHRQKLKRSGSNNNSRGSSAKMAGGQEDLPTCVICHKSFPSMKSLYGHMRSHPERKWRGVQPPPATTAKQSSSSTVSNSVVVRKADDDQTGYDDEAKERSSSVVDLSKSVPGWGVTAKRGKKAGTPSVTGSASGSGSGSWSGSGSGDGVGFDAQAQEALVMLANGNPPSKVSPLIRPRIEATTDDKEMENYKANCFIGSYSVFEARNCSETAEYKDLEAFSETGLKRKEPVNMMMNCVEEKQVQCSYYELVRKLKKRKRIKRLRDLEEVHADYDVQKRIMDPVTPSRFKCSICNKSFSSHQALGGHKSNHNKPTKNSRTIASDNGSVWAEFSAVRGSYKLNADLSTPSSQAANSPGAASETSGKVLGFDLNELPPMEDDKEGVAGLGADSGPCGV
ncbi:uncharacterized protein LOC115737039 [Rhodamnia argentea]|uniref:Uncharacterized protein LOC115737039 n=1 Tax=Rhodamnia argentea TaxID=178133 RepID=A0A8B8NSG8_9MYRT|nr:uncharacterized protein LOC115737039 [Rhodamnia argentea]XP_048130761.1 uncharacterized protein LOC115737039 [Rhodamnia argentea]